MKNIKKVEVNTKPRLILVPALALVMLAACGTRGGLEVPPSGSQANPPELPPPPVPDGIPGVTDAAVGTVTPTDSQDAVSGGRILGGIPITRESISDPSHPLAKRIVFFDYNSSRLKPDALDLVRGHAEYLSRFSDVRVRVEGHTDERGSREYNIALGDNRARSVARILQLQGVDAGQFSTLSYGEEVPLDEGQGENSWRRNRRVEVVYEGFN